MSETKFTSGPWEARYVEGAGWSVRRKYERPGYTGLAPICSMAWWQFDIPGIIDNEISGANAKLIAAAPELLEALQMMMRFAEHMGVHGPAMNSAADAIAKATK